MKRKLSTLILFLALLFVPTASAQAQSPDGGDVFLLGQNYTLSSDETLDGSLAVIGGNVTIEEGATVNGDVVVVGGNLTIKGDINGDAAIIGGNLTVSAEIDGDVVIVGGQAVLTETAVVDGNVSTIGGQVEKEPGAEITGTITNNAPPVDIPDIPNVPDAPNPPEAPDVPKPSIDLNVNPLWEVLNVIWRALAVAGIGMLLTLFLQPQLERVADAITGQPIMAGSFGLLAVVVTPLAILLMVVTLILIPVAIVVALLVPLAWLFGMIALGQQVGERFTKAINQTWADVLSTGFGTFLLVLVVGFIGLIPCVGWLLSFIVTLFAIGGVVITWFGTRNPPGRISAPPPSAPGASRSRFHSPGMPDGRGLEGRTEWCWTGLRSRLTPGGCFVLPRRFFQAQVSLVQIEEEAVVGGLFRAVGDQPRAVVDAPNRVQAHFAPSQACDEADHGGLPLSRVERGLEVGCQGAFLTD